MRIDGLPFVLESPFDALHAQATQGQRASFGGMSHVAARFAIEQILRGHGFGLRAVALTQAGMLGYFEGVPAGLPERLREAAAALPLDRGAADVPGIPGALPATQEDLARQILPLVTQHPGIIGMQAAATSALIALWPRATREERLRLRRLWYAGIMRSRAPQGAELTRQQLCDWQRDMPTTFSVETPTPSVLVELLDEPGPKGAYHVLATYLGPGVDIPTLVWTLGSCAGHAMVRRVDSNGFMLQSLLGTVACELMAPYAPCEHMLTLLSQLSHQIWWSVQRAGLDRVETSRHERLPELGAAIRASDYSAAQTAARRAVHDRAAYWAALYDAMNELLDCGHPAWPRALAAIAVTATRCGRNQIGPDDAAATAALVSTCFVGNRTC